MTLLNVLSLSDEKRVFNLQSLVLKYDGLQLCNGSQSGTIPNYGEFSFELTRRRRGNQYTRHRYGWKLYFEFRSGGVIQRWYEDIRRPQFFSLSFHVLSPVMEVVRQLSGGGLQTEKNQDRGPPCGPSYKVIDMG